MTKRRRAKKQPPNPTTEKEKLRESKKQIVDIQSGNNKNFGSTTLVVDTKTKNKKYQQMIEKTREGENKVHEIKV